MSAAKTVKRIGKALVVFSFWLVLWLIAARIVNKELLLPYPHTVIVKLFQLCATALFWKNVALTLIRIVLGTVLALIFGTGLAIVTSKLSVARRLAEPMITVIRATPVASFIILALIWLGSGKLPVFICFLMVLPIIWSAVSDGIAALDPKQKQVCQVYGLSFVKRFRYFYVPSVLPYFLSACKTSIGMAWKAGVAAEVLAVTPNSVGKQLYHSKLYLETAELFAWTAVVVLVSLAIEKSVSYLLSRPLKRRKYADR